VLAKEEAKQRFGRSNASNPKRALQLFEEWISFGRKKQTR